MVVYDIRFNRKSQSKLLHGQKGKKWNEKGSCSSSINTAETSSRAIKFYFLIILLPVCSSSAETAQRTRSWTLGVYFYPLSYQQGSRYTNEPDFTSSGRNIEVVYLSKSNTKQSHPISVSALKLIIQGWHWNKFLFTSSFTELLSY